MSANKQYQNVLFAYIVLLRRLGGTGASLCGGLGGCNVANGIVGIVDTLVGVKVAASNTRAVIVVGARNASSSGGCSSPVCKMRVKMGYICIEVISAESYLVVVLKIYVK
jgi:hypothetical protein